MSDELNFRDGSGQAVEIRCIGWDIGAGGVFDSVGPVLFCYHPGVDIHLHLVSALTLFIVGAVKASMTVGKKTRSGLQMAIIGLFPRWPVTASVCFSGQLKYN